jgi:NADH dehydrogenase FAD-containing subunit
LRGVGDGASRVALVTGGGAALSGAPPPLVQRGQQALRRLGVTVFQDSCTEVLARHVQLASGARLACDVPVLVLGPGAPAWLAGSGLALDERGFISTRATLQSLSHPEVFAAGDVATRSDMQHAKSGVYAVRAGPPLSDNLRRYVGGGDLLAHRPPLRTLNLLSCGGRWAIASYGDYTAQGRWVWWWKNFIDRRFIGRYALPVATTAASVTRAAEKK